MGHRKCYAKCIILWILPIPFHLNWSNLSDNLFFLLLLFMEVLYLQKFLFYKRISSFQSHVFMSLFVYQVRPLRYEDFQKAMTVIRPSLSKSKWEELERWNEDFGSNWMPITGLSMVYMIKAALFICRHRYKERCWKEPGGGMWKPKRRKKHI